MRILMLSWEYPPYVVGGLGKHVAELLPALTQQDVELHLVTPLCEGGAGTQHLGALTVHRVSVPHPCRMTFDAIQGTNQLLKQAADDLIASGMHFDLIHNHDWLTSFAARDLKQTHRLALITTIHATERGRGRGHLGNDNAERINQAEWWLCYDAWRVIVCADYMAGQVRDYFGKPRDNIDIIPNGVDPTPFRQWDGVDLTAFRARYAEPDQKLVFHVGRMVHEKGVEVLIRSVPEVIREVPHTRVVIAGKGPELPYLERLVNDLDLSSHVQLLGFVSDEDRNRLYHVADCAVFPSLYEPFGIVALEAMAAKTPVVVSAVGGLREVVQHAETGITVYPNDAHSCAWGISHTLQHPDWAQQRVRNAIQRVNTTYSWHTIAAQTREVYERVAKERRRAIW